MKLSAVWWLSDNMKQTIFIAGTDTGVGKTTVSVALLKILEAKGISAIGINVRFCEET